MIIIKKIKLLLERKILRLELKLILIKNLRIILLRVKALLEKGLIR